MQPSAAECDWIMCFPLSFPQTLPTHLQNRTEQVFNHPPLSGLDFRCDVHAGTEADLLAIDFDTVRVKLQSGGKDGATLVVINCVGRDVFDSRGYGSVAGEDEGLQLDLGVLAEADESDGRTVVAPRLPPVR